MLNGDALGLLQPKNNEGKKPIKISSQDGLVVVEAAGSWFAMSREETIQFIQMLADCLNRMS